MNFSCERSLGIGLKRGKIKTKSRLNRVRGRYQNMYTASSAGKSPEGGMGVPGSLNFSGEGLKKITPLKFLNKTGNSTTFKPPSKLGELNI